MEMSKETTDKKTAQHTDRDSIVNGPWLTVEQTATYLALSDRSVRELEYRHVLPGHRFGGSVRFSQPELDILLASRRQPTAVEFQGECLFIPDGALGPLSTPEEMVEYLGLPSVEALIKRVARLQLPAYRISAKIIRFRRSEVDQILSYGSVESLTPINTMATQGADVCLPGGKEVN